MERKTPLYDSHVKHGGKMVPFAGYSLPIQFKGLIAEHVAVRKTAGLFDVSHMTEIFIEGKDALKYVNKVFSNDFTKMDNGRVRYTLMLNENGGIVDDMVIYKDNAERFVMVGNGCNREKDFSHMLKQIEGGVTVTDKTDIYAQIAIQGPASKSILKAFTKDEHIPDRYYSYINGIVMGDKAIVSRTGYTGELGYELYVCPDRAVELWEALLETGKEHGLVPCGLGARDTLRLEASMPLYGNEMSDDTNPFEAGLGFVVNMDKDDFIGKSALLKQEITRKRVGIKVTGKGIVREGCTIFADGKEAGVATSGTHAPFLGCPIAMGYVNKEHSAAGTKLTVNVRGRMIDAEIIEMPFYKL